MKKRTKKNVRSMLSIVLALMMCISMTCPVFAADEMDGSPGADATEIVSQSAAEEQESETGEIETTETETSTEAEVEEQEEQSEDNDESVETATSSNAEKAEQPEGEETEIAEDDEQLKGEGAETQESEEADQGEGEDSENTEGDEQLKEDEIPAVIQKFLDAVDAVVSLGEVTDENVEEYNALYQAAMDAYEEVKAEGLEEDERVVEAVEKLGELVVMPAEDSDTFGVSNLKELADAIDTINSSGEGSYTIILGAGIIISSDVTISGSNEVTILGNGNTITLAGNAQLIVDGSAVLNLGSQNDSLTITSDGSSRSVAAINVQGTLNVYAGTTLTGFNGTGNKQTGGAVCNYGTFTMSGGLITDCKAHNGAGVYNAGTFTMTGGSIANCEAGGGAGVYNSRSGTFTINGGKITNCTAISSGGVYNAGTFIMTVGEITNCEATSTLTGGGGVYNVGTFTMTGGSIADCKATTTGGGVYNADGTFTMYGGKITDCTAVAGGGIRIEYGTSTIDGGLITCCTATNNGGGVHIGKGTFTMNSGTITDCKAPMGGGVTVFTGTFVVTGGSIAGCNASSYGGGVFANSGTSFNMTGGSIDGCTATTGGGGIYNAGKLTMDSGEITNCTVNDSGGGVRNDATFTMTGGSITNCTASNGGGVMAFQGTFIMSDGKITDCTVTTNGGGIYVNTGSAQIGNVYNNSARGAGDDIYAGSSGTFTVYPVNTGLSLSSTEMEITGWYYDGYRLLYNDNGEAYAADKTRWNAEETDENNLYLYEYTSTNTETTGATTALKAAHGVIEKKVTVTYEDTDGNAIEGYDPETQIKGSSFTVRDALKSTTDKEFVEWSGDDGKTYKPGDTVTPETDLVLTAVMKTKQIAYTVEWYDANGNTIKDTETRFAEVGTTVSVTEEDKNVKDYTFDEDNEGNVLSVENVAEGDTITLKLYFNKNQVKYTVEWLDADGNTIKDTETRNADVGTTVSVTEDDKKVKDYTFDEDNEGNVLSVENVAEGDTITLKLYFTKKQVEYTVEWYDADGNSIKDAEKRDATVGETVSVTGDDKTVEGYTFDKNNANNVLKATVAEDGSTVLKLYFTKKSTTPVDPVDPEPKDVTYKVEWYDVDGNSIKKADTRTAKAGTEVTVTKADKTVEGYTFDEDNANNVLKATVAEDGSTVLKLYFTKNSTTPVGPVDPEPKDVTYKVEWYDVDGNSIKATDTRSAKAGTTVSVKEADKVVEGYTFDANNKNNILTAVVAEDGSTVLKLYFTKNSTGPVGPVNPDKPKNTTYKVEWYNVDGNIIKATETRSAKAGTKVSVTEADKVVEGYTFDKDNANNILTAVVAEDGSTVLKLYFTKNSTPPTGPDKPENPETPKDTTYKVEWYDVDGNSIKTTEVRSAKVGTTVSVTEADKVVEGYTFDANNKNNILTAVVAEDGSTVLKLYFTKNSSGPDNNDTTPPTTPTEDTTPSNPNRDIPKTGDTTSNWALYLMLASGLALIVLLFAKRKEDK